MSEEGEFWRGIQAGTADVVRQLEIENQRLRRLLREALAREQALEAKLGRQDTDAARDRAQHMMRLARKWGTNV